MGRPHSEDRINDLWNTIAQEYLKQRNCSQTK